jgi:hypothetical protein
VNCRIVECSNKVLASCIVRGLQFCSLQLIAIVCVVVCFVLAIKVLAPRCLVKLMVLGGLVLRVAIRC